MNAELGTLLVSLTVLWFLVYWIFGGVVFAIISLVRPGKMKRVRFSCLYSIFSAFIAYAAAKLGIIWASEATGGLPPSGSLAEAFVVMGGLGFVGILLGLIAGFIVLFIGGWIIMLISRSKERSWYDRMAKEGEED